jgi:hypothetical protein
MNQYSTGFKKATLVSRRILQTKRNHYLDEIQKLAIDDNAYVPTVNSWTHVEGFRLTDSKASSEALKRAAHQWIRASCRSGETAVFVMELNKSGVVSVNCSNATANAVLQSNLPDCQISEQTWQTNGFRFSGILLGTLTSTNVADTIASTGLQNVYMACIVTPVADSVAQDILAEDRRLMATLESYRSIERVYGSASRRTQPPKFVWAWTRRRIERRSVRQWGFRTCSATNFTRSRSANASPRFAAAAAYSTARSISSIGIPTHFRPPVCCAPAASDAEKQLYSS